MRCRSWAIVFSPVLGIGPVYKSSSLDHTFSPVKSVPDDALMCGVIVNVWLFVSCFVFRVSCSWLGQNAIWKRARLPELLEK